MPPAARIGDKTALANLVGLGALNVFIGGMPAWICLSKTLRNKTNPPLPPVFVSGTVYKASTSVIINGRPAARIGDIVMEESENLKYPIIGGCPTVLIG
ncbi:MAG: hypothetical protein EHM14_01385 [Methanothrix sp.]|nr:MAG: hypothetical protein EHM14_01385 [Methanothrix sp.]